MDMDLQAEAAQALLAEAELSSVGDGAVDLARLLRSLRLLVSEKQLQRALSLVEEGCVVELVSARSGRRVFQIKGSSTTTYHFFAGLTRGFCSCKAFMFEVANKREQPFVRTQKRSTL